MHLQSLELYETESLCASVNAAIWWTHQAAYHLARGANDPQDGKPTKRDYPIEPDFVSTLVTDGTELIGRALSPILGTHGIDVRISGAFLHGRPYVRFGGNKKGVELADAMIVHTHTTPQATTSRALLIQAKMANGLTEPLSQGDLQLDLYRNWPPFKFVHSHFDSRNRKLPNMKLGCAYGLVRDRFNYPERIDWPDQCPWSICAPDNVLKAERSLGRVIVGMIDGRCGLAFDSTAPSPGTKPPAKDEWTLTVHDLLRYARSKTYTCSNIGRSRVSRHSPNFNPSMGNVSAFVQKGAMLSFTSWGHAPPPTLDKSTTFGTYFSDLPPPPDTPGDPPGAPPRRGGDDGQEEGPGSVLIIETFETGEVQRRRPG